MTGMLFSWNFQLTKPNETKQVATHWIITKQVPRELEMIITIVIRIGSHQIMHSFLMNEKNKYMP